MCGSHLFLFIISSVSTFSYLIFFSVYLPSIHTPTPHPPLAEEYTFYHRFSFIIIFIPFYHPVCRTRTAATNLEEWQLFEDRHNSLVKCHVCPEYTFNYVLLSNSSIRKRKEDNIIISNISRNTHFLLFLFSFLPLSLAFKIIYLFVDETRGNRISAYSTVPPPLAVLFTCSKLLIS